MPSSRPTLRRLPERRTAAAGDGDLLEKFECSNGRWFQDEVQEFINGQGPDSLLIPDRKVLLYTLESELIAVGAHQAGQLVTSEMQEAEVMDVKQTKAAQLVVLAITMSLQAARLRSGGRLSDHLMRDLLTDALRARRTDAAFAIVATENQRSLTMCERNGLTSLTTVTSVYSRATGRFTLPPQR